jgi:hypothetical protein
MATTMMTGRGKSFFRPSYRLSPCTCALPTQSGTRRNRRTTRAGPKTRETSDNCHRQHSYLSASAIQTELKLLVLKYVVLKKQTHGKPTHLFCHAFHINFTATIYVEGSNTIGWA